MRGPSIPYIHTQRYLEQCLNGISWRPLSIEEQRYIEKIKKVLAKQQRKFASFFNPFNLCPIGVSIWFPLLPSVALGFAFSGLNNIAVLIRQAIEPTLTNGFLAIRILELRVPSPLYFLTLFSAIGLFFNAKINGLVQASNDEFIAKQEEMFNRLEEKLNVLTSEEDSGSNLLENTLDDGNPPLRTTLTLNPFNLSPLSLTVFVPIYKNHTALGILFHDLNYMGFSILQALEPNDKIYSLFRFIHIQVPLALDLLVMLLVLGLFLSGGVNKVEQGVREEIIKEVKESIQELKKNY